MSDTEFDDTDDISDVGEPSHPPDVATVTIKGTGISITRDVDDATMSSIIAILFRGPTAVQNGGAALRQQQKQPQHHPDGGGAQPWDPELTLGEFLADTGARTFSQRICAAGYYRMKFEDHDSFDRDSIKGALESAHEDMPSNFTRDFAAAAANKLIAAKSGGTGQYFVTTSGRRAVESHFEGIPKRKASGRRKSAPPGGNGDAE